MASLAVACGSADGGEYTETNRALLSELPVFPGATVESVDDNPYHLTEPEGPRGWITNVVYRVEAGVTDADVVEFYTNAMGDDWESCREDIGVMPVQATGQPRPTPEGMILQVSFVRGGEQFGVNTDGLYEGFGDANDTYAIGLDHDAYQNVCTGQTLRE